MRRGDPDQAALNGGCRGAALCSGLARAALSSEQGGLGAAILERDHPQSSDLAIHSASVGGARGCA